MAQHSNVPGEILESMRENVDRRVKLSIKRLVNYETKKDKVEQRVLAFSTYRLFIFTAKNPTKVETNFHYLDIRSIESKKPNQMTITTSSRSYSFTSLEADTDEINHMITHIGVSLKTIFPAYPLERLIKKITVSPPERLHLMQDMMKGIEKKETGPCGGFTVMYSCMCDFHSLVYRDEVAWDVDTIYLSQDNHELRLKDFDHLKERDLVPIVSALVHNTWFTTLNANNVRLSPDVCNEILHVMKKNCVMEALLLSNTGINSEFVKKLSTLSMSDTQLEKLDLSNNMIDDMGAEHLFGSLSSRGKPVSFIDISGTKVTTKGLNKISEIMAKSSNVFSSLQTLKFAAVTSPKVEELQSLYTFLASPSMITSLDLSGTDVELEKLMTPLQRGCGQNLMCLVLSKTSFTYKKSREIVVPASFKQFFASVCSLKHLDLSGTKLPPDALKEMLLGMGSNRHLSNVHIDISSMDLQSSGAQNLHHCLSSVKCISSLNISFIGFQDNDLCAVLKSIGQNKAVKQLNMGRVFSNIKPKNLKMVLEDLVAIIQDDDSVIESLSLADSRLKESMNMIINALGSNTSLTEIDISGNQMGDLGARMLSKALQINNKLKTIVWDKNNTTWQGFEDIASALEKNYTVKKMPMPINDASVVLKTQAEKTEQALQTIERLLQRNHSPQKYSSDQAYRLQQGFLISSTQQMVDRLVVQAQDTINALTIDTPDAYPEDVQKARAFIKAADNSKTLLPSLHDIAIQAQRGGMVQKKLNEISEELKTVLESQMKKTVDEMLTATKKQCTALMEDEEFVTDIQSGCTEKSTLPKDFTSNVLDGVDTDIFNTLSELNLAVAAHVSDRVVDEVIERLSVSHKTLTNYLNEKKKGVSRRSNVSSQKMLDDETNQRVKGSESPSLTPHVQTKRKSIHNRKIRPQSVIDKDHVQQALDARVGSPKIGSRSPGQRLRSKAPPSSCTPIQESPSIPSSQNNSPRSTSPLPQIEVTDLTSKGVTSHDLDPITGNDPVYDNVVPKPRKCKPRNNARGQKRHDVLEDSGASPAAAPKPSSDPLVDNFDVVPELAEGPRPLTNVTKSRPQRKKNVRPTTRPSELPCSTGEKVDDNIKDFFTSSKTTVISENGGQASDTSSKTSSTKTTPEVKRKKSSGGLFGFGKQKNEDKDGKKRGFFSKPKPSPPPVASKQAHRVSDVQEEEAANSPKAKRSNSKSSLASSLEEEGEKKNSLPRSRSGSSNNSLEDSLKSNGSETGSIQKEKQGEKATAEKKPLPAPPAKAKKVVEDITASKGEDKSVESDTAAESDKDSVKEEKKEEAEVEEEKKEDEVKVEDKDSKEDEQEEEKEEKSEAQKEPDVEEEKKEPVAEESPKPTMRKPPAGLGAGFGGNILAEMMAKQEKRKTQLPNASKTPDKPSPKEEKTTSPFGNIGLKPTKLKQSDGEKEKKEATPTKPPALKSSDSDKTVPVKPSLVKQSNEANSEGTKPSALRISNTDKPSAAGDKPSVLRKSSQKEEEKPASVKPSDLRKSDNKTDSPSTSADEPAKESEDSKTADEKAASAGLAASLKKSKPTDNLTNAETTEKRSASPVKPGGPEVKKLSFNEEDVGKPDVPKRPAGGNKPPPPRKPKPPMGNKPTPAPRRSTNSDIVSPDEVSNDVKMEEKPEMIDSGIVYDSDTLKLSVREKAAKLGNSGGETGGMKKSDSLPRNSRASFADKDVDVPQRPKSMFSLLDSRPDLKPDHKGDSKDKPEAGKVNKPDESKVDKPETEEADADDVILV